MSNKNKKHKQHDFNFLLDEFFIYKGLDDLERQSIKQDEELELLMSNCYEILNKINKIKSSIRINEKVKQIKQLSFIDKYGYKICKKKEISKKKEDKKIGNISNRSSNLNLVNVKRNSFCNIQKKTEKSKKNEVNPLYSKKSLISLELKDDDDKNNNSNNIVQINNYKILDLKGHYSPNLSIKKNKLNRSDIYLDRNSKKENNKVNNKKFIKKLTIKKFKISLLD